MGVACGVWRCPASEQSSSVPPCSDCPSFSSLQDLTAVWVHGPGRGRGSPERGKAAWAQEGTPAPAGAGHPCASPAALQSGVWLRVDSRVRQQGLSLLFLSHFPCIVATSGHAEPTACVYWGLRLRGLWERILRPSLRPSSPLARCISSLRTE